MTIAKTKPQFARGPLASLGYVIGVIALSIVNVPQALGADFIFNKIADFGTPIPDGSDEFLFFGIPALDGDRVAFFGASNTTGGFYDTTGGTLGTVVDINTIIPGTAETFTLFSLGISLDGPRAAFIGEGANDFKGIFMSSGGALEKIFDSNDNIPGSTSNFQLLGLPSLSGDDFATIGINFDDGLHAIFTFFDDTLNTVADLTTLIPDGSGAFTSLNGPSFDKGHVAFVGTGLDQQGVYSDVGGSLEAVADLATAQPDGFGNFDAFLSGPQVDGEHVAFAAIGPGFVRGSLTGIYLSDGDSLTTIVDSSTPLPGQSSSFLGLFGLSFDAGNVAFIASRGEFSGIYTTVGGELMKVIDVDDVLDGKELDGLIAGSQSLSGDSIAFRAIFADETEAIYVATIPEPSTGVLAFLGMALLALCGLSRRHASSPSHDSRR